MRGGHISKHRSPATSNIPNDYRIDGWKVYKHQPKVIIDEPEKYNGTGIVVCSSFGCRKQLSLTEQLCGDKCLSCQGKKKLDVTKVMKFK